MFLALVQLALMLHVRNTVADAASSGARYGALADRTAQDARERTTALIETALGSGYAYNVSTAVTMVDGLEVMTVEVTAPWPLIGLFGPSQALHLSGHAVLPGK